MGVVAPGILVVTGSTAVARRRCPAGPLRRPCGRVGELRWSRTNLAEQSGIGQHEAPLASPPLNVGLTPGDGVTSAHVIEAMLAHSPRLHHDVLRLEHQRRTGGGSRAVARGQTQP